MHFPRSSCDDEAEENEKEHDAKEGSGAYDPFFWGEGGIFFAMLGVAYEQEEVGYLSDDGHREEEHHNGERTEIAEDEEFAGLIS